uniref:Uncharacterized protein n=1 Tax=Plectus sambesii TaxID=2011161 RepID=A0A914V3H8_9BILA
MYRGSGVRTKGSKRGRGGQRSTWNEACDAPAETTYYQKRRNSFTRKLPLLDPPEHPYDHRRKKHALANKVGASRFNWKQADATCHYTPSHLVYPPADSQSQDQLEDDPSGYGQAASFCGQEERNQSPSAFSDDYGQESKITSEDPWSDEYQGRESERSHSERDVDERLEKMRKELSDYARDERIYKTQLKEYRAQNHELLLCRSGQMKTIKKLKADLVEWAKRKEADGMKISQLTKQLEAKYNEAASRDIEQSKRIVQLEAELLAATKKAELSAKEALDEHLNRLKEQLVASSYLPD